MVPRVENVSEVHLPYTDTTTCFTRSPEPIVDALPPNQVPPGSESHAPGLHESQSNNSIESPPPIPAKDRQVYPSPVPNTSNPPKYTFRAETPVDLPASCSRGNSTPILKYSDPTFVGESSTASGSGGTSDAAFSGPLPPSYTETPFPAADENIKQNTSHNTNSSLVSTQNPTQFSAYTPPSRPSSSASASPSTQHRLPFTASQVGSSTDHLSRNSSAQSSPNPDGSLSDLHSARPSSNSTINVNAFVNKELFVGVCELSFFLFPPLFLIARSHWFHGTKGIFATHTNDGRDASYHLTTIR